MRHPQAFNWRVLGKVIVLASLTVTLAACTYDQLNRSDRITFAGGNAVRANIERETANPSKPSMFAIGGLGKDGVVIPDETGEGTP